MHTTCFVLTSTFQFILLNHYLYLYSPVLTVYLYCYTTYI